MISITVTTKHPVLSYGEPIAVIDGELYGPTDLVCTEGRITTAADLVSGWAQLPERTPEEVQLVEKFLSMTKL